MEFIKIGDRYINMKQVKYVQVVKDGLEIFLDVDIITISGEVAKYFREILDGSHFTTVAEINRKMPDKGSNK